MAIRNIVQVGDDVLRKKCFEVTEVNDKIRDLLDDMKDTLIKADGAGLAAPQIGVLKRIFVVSVDDKYYECINPKILEESGSQIGDEGCLSVKGRFGKVDRPMRVKLTALDRFGKPFTVVGTGLMARAFCHENDHLDGILYIDKAQSLYEDK